MMAEALGQMAEVVGIDADAVAADQTRLETEEIPLGPARPPARPTCERRSWPKICGTSFMKATLMSRWAFSIDLGSFGGLDRGGAEHAGRW